MPTAPDHVHIETGADRVIATLRRPEKRNAINAAMVTALHNLCDTLIRQPRTLILTGAGTDFAAGADIAELHAWTPETARRGTNSHLFTRIARLPMPVIAALDGYALGGGAELAYAADLRIGTPRLRIGSTEARLGIMPAAGATWRLPALVGGARASEMLLTGRVISGDTALAWGLVSSLHEPSKLLEAAHAVADRIDQLAPRAVQHTKTALHAPATAHPLVDLDLQAELIDHPDTVERMTQFLHRRGH